MKPRPQPTWALCTVAAALVVAASGCGSGPDSAKGKAKIEPATVTGARPESEIAHVELTPEAESRLGIATVPLIRRRVPRRESHGARVVAAPGKSITVSAPLAGFVTKLDDDAVAAGSRVSRGSRVVAIVPILTPERRALTPGERLTLTKAHADLALASAQARAELLLAEAGIGGARTAAARAETLLAGGTGSEKRRDESRADLDVAQARLSAARDTVLQLADIQIDVQPDTSDAEVPPLFVATPLDGVVTAMHVAPGQVIPAGAPLFDVLDDSQLWLRVSVFAGDIDAVDAEQPAHVLPLSGVAAGKAQVAMPVAAPPSANADASAVYLYYALDNRDGSLRPEQRVSASIGVHGSESAAVLPASSVLYDSGGGTWVYVRVAPRTYSRVRIEIDRMDGNTVLLARGPDPASEVVVKGAPELFGTEFGIGK